VGRFDSEFLTTQRHVESNRAWMEAVIEPSSGLTLLGAKGRSRGMVAASGTEDLISAISHELLQQGFPHSVFEDFTTDNPATPGTFPKDATSERDTPSGDSPMASNMASAGSAAALQGGKSNRIFRDVLRLSAPTVPLHVDDKNQLRELRPNLLLIGYTARRSTRRSASRGCCPVYRCCVR